MATTLCKECGAQIVWLDMYNALRKPSDADPVTNPEAPPSVRWYITRQRGAVPATMVERPKEEPFLKLHTCRRTRVGFGDTAFAAHTIANSKGPLVPDVGLDERFSYSYRWPTSWAHIALGPLTLCGARVHDLISDAERRRLQQMHVCPKCLERYPVRLSRL